MFDFFDSISVSFIDFILFFRVEALLELTAVTREKPAFASTFRLYIPVIPEPNSGVFHLSLEIFDPVIYIHFTWPRIRAVASCEFSVAREERSRSYLHLATCNLQLKEKEEFSWD